MGEEQGGEKQRSRRKAREKESQLVQLLNQYASLDHCVNN